MRASGGREPRSAADRPAGGPAGREPQLGHDPGPASPDPELVSQAAEDRLAELAEAAAEDGDREAAAVYRFHRELILHCRAAGVDDAVAHQREALEAVPRLVDDGSAAYRRYRTTASQTDLTAALASFEQAASLAGPGHPDRPVVLNNLGLALFEQLSPDHHRHADLDRAVAVLEESAGTAPMDAAERSAALANLGSALLARRGAGGFGRDLERAARFLMKRRAWPRTIRESVRGG